MASAEKLLHDAQYAFHSISFGESSANSRNRRRASRLARKIIRKFPTSPETSEAHAILRRLGEEAYVSNLNRVHRHSQPASAIDAQVATMRDSSAPLQKMTSVDHETVPLDWHGLVSVLAKLPKTLWFVFAFLALFFFNLLGFFILLPLLAILLFTGPFRGLMQPRQREEMNKLIIRANAMIDQQLRSG
jgi:hypothetical protein